jgi:hypothetical protein
MARVGHREVTEAEKEHLSLILRITQTIQQILPSREVKEDNAFTYSPFDEKREHLEILQLTPEQKLLLLRYLNTKGLECNHTIYLLDRRVFWAFLTLGHWVEDRDVSTNVDHAGLWILQIEPGHYNVYDEYSTSFEECHFLSLHDNYQGVPTSLGEVLDFPYVYPNLFPLFEYELSCSSIQESQVISDYVGFVKAGDLFRSGVLAKYFHRIVNRLYSRQGSSFFNVYSNDSIIQSFLPTINDMNDKILDATGRAKNFGDPVSLQKLTECHQAQSNLATLYDTRLREIWRPGDGFYW